MFTTPTVAPKLAIKQRLDRNQKPFKPAKLKKPKASPLLTAILNK